MIRSIELRATLHIEPGSDGPTTTLVLNADDDEAKKTLQDMIRGNIPDVDGLRYCHINTVCPHTFTTGGVGVSELIMTVNYRNKAVDLTLREDASLLEMLPEALAVLIEKQLKPKNHDLTLQLVRYHLSFS